MKKLIALVLSLALCLGMMSFAAAEEAPLSVAICVAETFGDMGFYDSANEGLSLLEEKYGVEGHRIECNSDASMYSVALIQAAEQCDIVAAVGWQFWDGLCEIVPELPETKFISIDNALDGVGDNLLSIIYADNEGSFLAGYVAMKMAANGVVGVVAAEDSETINNFVVGYAQGALYANPEGKVLDAVYTNGDYDSPDLGKEAADSLYGKGADVVFAVAGKTGLGVFSAAEEQGKYAVGVDGDQKPLSPETIICSMVKNVGQSIYTTVATYLEDGTFEGGTIWEADLSTGILGLAYGDESYTQQVPDELKQEVEALAAAIMNGEIVVDSTRK